ncbi:discoidin domain-containing protein [Sphingobacterium sp. SRCM116780]|uniref:discoidin domain-containing protein n=1 Tax=Sphingobacterium sp. SRCM116780 TaxID=2907623 RepID=UPI001F1D35D2|nr:discoidin domain-containing protein [Sphingobacterium sp. SRCM116780]UIR56029.1 discoidin domain-containing protein [Sphingobacterium sp. SRCM116780]
MNKLTKSRQFLLFVGIMLSFSACKKTEVKHYELLPPEKEAEMDITIYGKLSVNHENGGGVSAGEGSPKVVDDDYATKFLINPFYNDLFLQLTFPGGIAVTSYVLASANDAPGRDPKDWDLVGSNDGENWTTLDSRTGYTFPDRDYKIRFDLSNTAKYKFYKLNIKAIAGGSGLFQLAEWRLISDPQKSANL